MTSKKDKDYCMQIGKYKITVGEPLLVIIFMVRIPQTLWQKEGDLAE